MRPVRGFERPVVQWAFVTLAVVLIALVVSLSLAVRRIYESGGELRAERDRVDERLARERSTREALSLELARLRAGAVAAETSAPPTLTLEPLRAREAMPPPATMTAPPRAQTVELRLLLPRGADPKAAGYELTVRDWVTGQARLTRGGLTTATIERRQAVIAYVPGDVFAAGSHEVILRRGESELATYEITVK